MLMNTTDALATVSCSSTGACAGVCACSTCHVILEDTVYDKLPEASETEEDMLDQACKFQIVLVLWRHPLTLQSAVGLTHTSRLGCQVLMERKHDGITVCIPSATRNFYVVS